MGARRGTVRSRGRTGQESTGGPLFAAAPLIAAPFFSLRSTVGTGVAAIVSVLLLRLARGTLSQVVPVTELITVVTVSVLAV
ncbi:MAG TPA: hypothetical protein VIS29_21205, partial [Streptomyces sp.]